MTIQNCNGRMKETCHVMSCASLEYVYPYYGLINDCCTLNEGNYPYFGKRLVKTSLPTQWMYNLMSKALAMRPTCGVFLFEYPNNIV